ncbi:phage holin [Rossellomorea marisflavi]|uniref:Phage holin n=1 Tax=Rossellomorea marisflavi TaxID=189381 RepID=A0A5D4RYP1_9BACI|nr:phage holin [Rossellomorea marisflavi]TYS56457.1 phage holin [Rossellomorea marisflavi]
MNELTNVITQGVAEVVVVLIGSLLSYVLFKVKSYFHTLKKKDELGIIDIITDLATDYAEAELKGKPGLEKRDFAVKKALEMLAAKGIKLSEAEVIAGIENGVKKLNNK